MSETTNKDLEAKVAAAEAQASQAQTQVSALETTLKEKDARIAELEAQAVTLEEQAGKVEPLQAEVDKLQAQIADSEAEATRGELKQFASAHGLDLEDEAVAKAIAELDYKTLMAESAKVQVPAAKPVVAPHAFSAGLQTEPYGGLLGSE